LLYTDSTIALNPDTGKLAWYFQHQPNDQWDYDWAFGRMLLKTSPNGKTLVATGGKQAIFDVVEADTGKYSFSVDLGVQDVVVGIDPVTGAKKLNPKLIPGGGETITTCPHAGGAKNWMPESYNPETKVLFVSLVEACMDLTPVAPGAVEACRRVSAGRCVHVRTATASTAVSTRSISRRRRRCG
jgi:alcohol dehydrogenase (cytochrome c)